MVRAELPFEDRRQAGRVLAERLLDYRGRSGLLVLGLPRGGVPVAYEVARALGAPLDVYLVRKLGVPGHEELAMGAISSGGTMVLNRDVIGSFGISRPELDRVATAELAERRRQERAYREGRSPLEVAGKTVILVDDGLATGSTMQAAVAALRAAGPNELVVAAPVASAPACAELEGQADSVVCVATPEPFYAVGVWYENFSPTSDDEVRLLLADAAGVTPVS